MTPSTAPTAPAVEPVKDAKGKTRGWSFNGSTFRTKALAEQAAAALARHAAVETAAAELDGASIDEEAAHWAAEQDAAEAGRPDEAEPVDPSTLTAEQRVARMPADELPPLPERPYNERPAGDPAPEPTSTRRRSGHPRVVAGRLRSRATANTYRVDYDPAAKFPGLASHVTRLTDAITALDGYVDRIAGGEAVGGTLTEADLESAARRVEREVYEAYNAGLPTPAIGSIIGASGGSARGRARRYARKHGLPMPEGASTSTRTPRDRTPEAPVTVSARYSAILAPVYHAAIDGELLGMDVAMTHAFVNGVPPRAIGRCAGLPSSAVRKRVAARLEATGKQVPDVEARKAARSALALPELPDD